MLEGIKVLDLTTVVFGPYATQTLGDMGAEILKIEPAGGDIMRAPGPGRSPGMGAAFLNCNRNKQSVALDLKQPGDVTRLLALIDEADIPWADLAFPSTEYALRRFVEDRAAGIDRHHVAEMQRRFQ